METVISRATKSDVRREPFPHLILENAIDGGFAAELIRNYPPVSTIAEGKELGSNKRFSYGAEKVKSDSSIAPAWKEFIARHVTQEFLEQVTDLFAEHIPAMHP